MVIGTQDPWISWHGAILFSLTQVQDIADDIGILYTDQLTMSRVARYF